MKKSYVLFMLLLMLFPLEIKSLEDNPDSSTEIIVYSYPETGSLTLAHYSHFYINISELESVGYLEMKMQYDKNVVKLHNCSYFNYPTYSCPMDSNNKYLLYKYDNRSNDYSEYVNDYSFYRVILEPTINTPKAGTSQMTIEFENGEDLNGNPILVEPLNIIVRFADGAMSYEQKKEGVPYYYIGITEESALTTTKENESGSNINKSEVKKSANNYLANLEIDNYAINFNREKKNYYITVEKDINKLDLKIELENDKATYKVVGADNLKENNHKVLIEVTAENGETKTYTISVRTERNKIVIVGNDNQDKKFFKLDKKYFIIGGITLFLIIIVIIIVNRNNRKIERDLDNL